MRRLVLSPIRRINQAEYMGVYAQCQKRTYCIGTVELPLAAKYMRKGRQWDVGTTALCAICAKCPDYPAGSPDAFYDIIELSDYSDHELSNVFEPPFNVRFLGALMCFQV